MSLQFERPPDWLIQQHMNQPNPVVEGLQGANQIMQSYAQQKAQDQQKAMQERQYAMLVQKEEREGRNDFYNYGDVGGLPKEVQSQIDQPAQGPVTEAGAAPQLPPIIERYNQFLKQNPAGLKGSERKNNADLQASEIDKNAAMAEHYRRNPAATPEKPEKAPAGYRWTTDGNLEAIPGGPATIKDTKDSTKINTTFELYETARDGLLTGLEGSVTGPVAGRIPAVTEAQQTAEGGVSAMAPVLKQLFRVAGEGTFTDRDQDILINMIPTRTDHPEARAKKIANIDNIVKAKLGMGKPSTGGLDPAKQSRLQELRAKRDAGTLR